MKTPDFSQARVLIIMGVAGCGKTTVASLLAKETGAIFYEGDGFHPPENIAKMRSGIPLTDQDREIWLQKLREIILSSLATDTFAVLTCSALKSKYRELMRGDDARVQFVHLTGPRAIIEARLKNRQGHFMPPGLLDSQLAILEPPADALVFNCELSPEKIVAELMQILK